MEKLDFEDDVKHVKQHRACYEGKAMFYARAE
jgi:hypothetical protein